MNSKRILGLAMVIVGTAITSSTVTWLVLDKKYKKITQAEIDDMKAYLESKAEKSDISEEDEEEEPIIAEVTKPSAKPSIINEYESMVKKEGYVDYTGYTEEGPVDPDGEDMDVEDEDIDIEIIEPDRFTEFADYTERYLTLYADGYLVDDMTGEVVEPNDCVGEDNLSRMGEYESNLIHIRNHKLKVDYEVTYDLDNYEGD